MKVRYTLLVLSMLLSVLEGVGQTVSVPDANFKACLLEKHPGTLDAGQNLIISEAANVTGVLSCSNRQIQNAEGIQYFQNVTEINLADNNLSMIPQISSMNNLRILTLSNNNLEVLPPLNGLGNLTELHLSRNNLRTLPDLSGNGGLVSINAHSNQIESLPNLDALVNLSYLNLGINKLTSLPELNSLTSIRELRLWRNDLVELPSMENLNELHYLDASTNQINKFPSFSATSNIRTIFLERNSLTELPDFSIYDHLQRVRVYDNNLTFEDLVPLTFITGYDTTFPASPQSRIKVGKSYQILEGKELLLSAGVDHNVEGANFQWIYNGKTVKNSPEDFLLAATESVSHSGFYYIQITHPDFPDLVLQTDSFYVNVLPCINLSGFSTVVSSTTCVTAGSLTIKTSNQPQSNLTYELKSQVSGKVFESDNGIFKDLNEPEYRLIVKAGEKCIKEYPDKINIPVQKCDDVFITPNGDGVDDNYFFSDSGTAKITDKFGNLIRTIAIPGFWDGTGNSGIVPPGVYIININEGETVIKLSVVY